MTPLESNTDDIGARAGVRWARWWILAAAVVMQLCLGATYSWSVYVKSLRELTGLSQGPTQLPFSVFYVVFPATMLVSGTLLSRIGPRRCAMAGGVLFGGGWLCAALGGKHFAFTVLGIGVLGGVGVGLAYIVPIATCMLWFPEKKGLVTGIAVAGFGGGAALVAKAAGTLMAHHGASPFTAFGLLGIAFLCLVILAAMAMRNPPGAKERRRGILKPGEVVRERRFRILYAAMFVGLVAGFTVNANMKELYQSHSQEAGISAVALFALTNAVGRIIWGMVFDRVRSTVAISANLLFQAGLFFCSGWILRSDFGLQAFALVSGFNYGGVLVIYASAVARSWGADRVGQVYGWLFSSNIPAALAPVLAGYVYDLQGSFGIPLLVIAMALVFAALFVRNTKSELEEERFTIQHPAAVDHRG